MHNALVVDREFSTIPSVFAAQALTDRSKTFDVIVLGEGIHSPSPVSLIRLTHQHRPGLPIFVLEGETSKRLIREAVPLGLQGLIPRPSNVEGLYEQLWSRMRQIPPAKSRELRDPGEAPPTPGFVPILARHFFWSEHTVFDVYVRLNSGKLVKIVNCNETFDEARLLSYINRGVMHFFIREQDLARMLSACDEVAKRLVIAPDVGVDVRAAPVLQLGDLTLDFMKRSGVHWSSLQAGVQFTHHLGMLMKRPEWSRDVTIKGFLSQVHQYQHGMAVAFVAALMLREQQLLSPRLMHVLGLASLFHDLGENEPGPEKEHPLRGAIALGRGPGVDPLITQIVEQHHERRSRLGYPKRLGESEILPMAQIVGLADEFVTALTRHAKGEKFNVRDHLEGTVFDGFSYTPIEALRRLLTW